MCGKVWDRDIENAVYNIFTKGINEIIASGINKVYQNIIDEKNETEEKKNTRNLKMIEGRKKAIAKKKIITK